MPVENCDPIKQADSETLAQSKWAWYAYFAAYEPVSILVMQLLFPLLLNTHSLLSSHSKADRSVRCTIESRSEDCVLVWNRSPSLFTYFVLAASVVAQTIAFGSGGALGDYGRWRGRILYGCTILGGLASLLSLGFAVLAHVTPSAVVPWLFGQSGLFILLQVVFGTASICYNAVLPLIVSTEIKDGERATVEGEMNEVSLKGMISGYSASLVELGAAAVVLFLFPAKLYSNAIPIATAGVIWSVVGCLAIRKMPHAHLPGMPIPADAGNLVVFSWMRTWNTLKSLKKLPNLQMYLLCYLFFSDGYGTIGMVAVLFARTEMQLREWMIVLAMSLLLLSCILGSVTFILLKKSLFKRLSSIRMIIMLCVLQSVIPVYGLLGIFHNVPIGFKQPWEAFMIAAYYGFNIGACNSFSRVAYAELLPPGREAEYFSLFAITDKGSSVLGPVVFTICAIVFNEKRWGLLFLLLMLLIPIPFLLKINIEEGKAESRKIA